MAKAVKWYMYQFSDGYYCYVRGLSATEIKIREKEHGKIIKKMPCG